jgi:hypothetical protein
MSDGWEEDSESQLDTVQYPLAILIRLEYFFGFTGETMMVISMLW